MSETVGKRMVAFRKSLGLSQRAFAEAIGSSHARIGAIETDKSGPSRSIMQKLSEVYGISSDWLLNGRGAMMSEGEAHPVPLRQVDQLKLMFCGNVVEEEYKRAGKKLDRKTHFDEAVWAYNELLARMTDPKDGEEMEAVLAQIRIILRRKLAAEA